MAEIDSDFDGFKSGVTCDEILTALVRASARTSEWRKTIDRRVQHQEQTIAKLLEELRVNTAETKKARETVEAIHDGMTALRVAKKVVVWAGMIAAAGSAIWLFVQQMVSSKAHP